jgi:hypothetical protein
MIAYNKTWLNNLRTVELFKTHLKQQRITAEEFSAISAAYPVGFYTPGFLARAGLAILTFVIVLFGDGLLSLIFWASGAVAVSGWMIFLGLLSYAGLELMIYTKNHFRSGVDDALLFLSALQVAIGFAILFYGVQENYAALSLIVFLMTLFLTIRFLDTLMAALCVVSLFSFVFFEVENIGAVGLMVIPFVLMIASTVVYFPVMRIKDDARFINYTYCFVAAQAVCLLTFYAAGNYYIVQTLSDEINGPPKPIALAPFFWTWTFLIPLLYLTFGVKRKDVLLIRISLFLIAAAALTFRTYYHVLPVDIMLTLSGAIILVLVYSVTKYLKKPKHGFTLQEPDEANLMDNLKIESLVVAQTFGHTQTPQNDGLKFGGGDFGGGGSSGGF